MNNKNNAAITMQCKSGYEGEVIIVKVAIYLLAAAVVGACIGMPFDSLLNTGYVLRIVGAAVGFVLAFIWQKRKDK